MRQTVTEDALAAEIARIRSLPPDALRRRWRAEFGRKPPAGLSRDLLGRMIAWHIQERTFGGLDRERRTFLDGLARHGGSPRRQFKPGTVLVREYRGERHTVTVCREGFDWQGTTYPSLSAIARAITGTSWNGPRFFNVCAAGNGPKRKTKSAATIHPQHHRVPAAGRHGSQTPAGGNPAPLHLETTSQA